MRLDFVADAWFWDEELVWCILKDSIQMYRFEEHCIFWQEMFLLVNIFVIIYSDLPKFDLIFVIRLVFWSRIGISHDDLFPSTINLRFENRKNVLGPNPKNTVDAEAIRSQSV